MKPWMKVLMYLGFGTVVGYFVGDRMGYKRGYEAGVNHEQWVESKREAINSETEKKAGEALQEYRQQDGDNPEPEWVREAEENIAEEPEMPTEEEIQIDSDIPQLHPTHLTPEIIGEEEYNANIWQYDLENLIFYEMDEVLYNETTQSIIENPDDVIGIGTLFEFGGDPNNPTETIYVKNDTYGVLFRIDRLDAAYIDAVAGMAGPREEDPYDPDDFNEDDL